MRMELCNWELFFGMFTSVHYRQEEGNAWPEVISGSGGNFENSIDKLFISTCRLFLVDYHVAPL